MSIYKRKQCTVCGDDWNVSAFNKKKQQAKKHMKIVKRCAERISSKGE